MRVSPAVWGCVMIGVLGLVACDQSASNTPPVAVAPEAVVVETPAAEPEPVPVTEPQVAPEPEALPELPTYKSVHDVMEDIGRSFQFLRRNMDKPDNDAELLERVATMRTLVTVSQGMTPKQVERAEEKDRVTLGIAYSEHLATLPPLLDELEAALKAGDRDAAKAALNKLHDAEHEGHEALGVD